MTEEYEIISDLLKLVEVEIEPEKMKKWTPQELKEVEKWAAKTYLKASDNNVRIPKKPSVLGGE